MPRSFDNGFYMHARYIYAHSGIHRERRCHFANEETHCIGLPPSDMHEHKAQPKAWPAQLGWCAVCVRFLYAQIIR